MGDHHTTTYHDTTLAVFGHHSLIVYVHETKDRGLHCEDCGWYGGGFKGRWVGRQMGKTWQKHADFVQAGGVVTHGRAANVEQDACRCVTCEIAWRGEQNARERTEADARRMLSTMGDDDAYEVRNCANCGHSWLAHFRGGCIGELGETGGNCGCADARPAS